MAPPWGKIAHLEISRIESTAYPCRLFREIDKREPRERNKLSVALQRALVVRSKQSEKVSRARSREEKGREGEEEKKEKYAKGRGDNEIAIATRRRRVSGGNSMHKRRVRASVYFLVGREESIMKGRRNISFEIRSKRRLYYIFE